MREEEWIGGGREKERDGFIEGNKEKKFFFWIKRRLVEVDGVGEDINWFESLRGIV